MNKFLDSYYEWSIQDALREASWNFASVRTVRGIQAVTALEAIESFLPSVREDLIVALVRRRHQRDLSAGQRELLLQFDHARAGIPAYTFLDKMAVRTPADQKKLRRIILESAAAVLGTPQAGGGSDEPSFRLVAGGHVLSTFIDTGGRSRQLEYNHTIWLQGESYPAAEVPINLMAWLGLSSTTKWDLLTAGEEIEAVESLLEFGQRFISALPKLLPSRST